jgi:hypothetical protein
MNSKKLKITEAQYGRLLQLMTETPFDAMAKQNIQVGDVVRINWKNSNNNFKVVDNNGGQIIMDNIDAGSTNINNRYFMSFTSLDGDDLDLRKVNKVKNPEKLDDIKSWDPITVKDLSNIEVFRDGKLVDTVDPMSPTADKQQKKSGDASQANIEPDFMDKVNNDLAIIIEQLDEKKGINFIFNSGFVNFCCVDKTDSTFVLEVNKTENTTLPDLNKWDYFILDLKGDPDHDNLFLKNQDVVSTSDGKTYNLKFKVSVGQVNKEILVKAIKGVSVLPDCMSSDEDRPEDQGETPNDEKVIADAEKALQMILNDPSLKDVFYKQPTFWERFKADLQGKKAQGTGLLSVIDTIYKYTDKKISEKIGKGFIKNNQAKFIPAEDVAVKYRDDNDVIHTYVLPMIEDLIRVRRHEIDDVTQVLQKTIPNSPLSLRILVKNKTDDPNTKLCDVQVGVVQNNRHFVEKGSTSDVKIKFLNSDGYQAQSEQIQTN